jgi:hypothetical protein
MKVPGSVVLVLAAILVACSGSGAPGNGGSGSSGGGSSGGGSSGGGSSGSGSSGASSSGGSSSGGGGSDSGADPDAGVSADSITFTMGPFTVPAGTEVFKCQTFANPFGGQTTDIKEYDEHMTTGSHHMFLFFSPGATDGAIEDCPSGGLEFHPYPFGAQTPDATLTYPPTVGSQIPGTMGFMLNAHFINIETTDYQATMTVTLHVAAPGAVTQYAGVMFMNQAGITVPATDMPSTSTATCNTPYAMNVMGSSSHMHNRSTDFVATTGSQTLYTTQTWADPIPGKYDPPIALPANAPITWSCTYVNDTTETLTFGESAETNVMCIYSMQFYPVADPTNPTIDCEKL